ncbi:hypothetical protein [Moraxella nonliquefaciens]|uniref:Uncharacterized protein n=1 Tax=Moraxella nonliquefaciens TaxID=478 RepID=A0A1B8PJ78_MORNO|nr:hypothetical protein [Moraxella nonliquefaciens]OBX50292.1 hypothetical protein A9Z60_09915 [Moraxella nonliquefaciens]
MFSNPVNPESNTSRKVADVAEINKKANEHVHNKINDAIPSPADTAQIVHDIIKDFNEADNLEKSGDIIEASKKKVEAVANILDFHPATWFGADADPAKENITKVADIITKRIVEIEKIWDEMGEIATTHQKLPRTGEYHIYDPLTLDLNGNGIIDVIGTDGYKGALFVHDNLNIPAINEEERWVA